MLSQALGRLLAVAEAYPDLKANQNFMALQDELTSTEDRIAAARRYYNANVRDAQHQGRDACRATSSPAWLESTKAEYFEAEGEQREAPRVDFGTNGPATPSGPSVGQAPAAGGQLPPGPQDSPPPQG